MEEQYFHFKTTNEDFCISENHAQEIAMVTKVLLVNTHFITDLLEIRDSIKIHNGKDKSLK